MAEHENISYERRAYILGLGFFGIFMAFNTAQSLATSLPGGPENLGYVCLAALYGTFTVACFFVPPWINKIGPKLAMVLGGIPYIFMVGATLKPSYYLSVPMNVLVGLGAPLLWTGSSVYLGRCAVWESFRKNDLPSQQKQRVSLLTAKFNSIFFMLFQGNGTIGLVISSLILKVAGSNAIRLLFILLVIVCAGGVFVLTTIPTVDAKKKETTRPLITGKAEDDAKVNENLLNEDDAIPTVSWRDTLRLAVRDPKMTLLVPIIFYNGLSLAFLFGDFTSIVAGQSISFENTGFAMATFYFVNAAFSYLSGTCGVRRVGRTPFLALAVLCHAYFFGWLLTWSVPTNYKQQCSVDDCSDGSCSGDACVAPFGPGLDHTKKYELELETPSWNAYLLVFAGAAIFAIGDAIWESFPAGIIQYFYKDDDEKLVAASANLKMWQSLGFAVQFVLGIVLKDYETAKLIILLSFQAAGAAGLAVLHVSVKSLDFKSETDADDDDAYAAVPDDESA